MSQLGDANGEARFLSFIEELVAVIGHADRAGPLKDHCTGLLLPVDRKSVEPMAALTAPSRVAAQHRSLLHFVGQSPWSDEAVLAKVGAMVTPAIESGEEIEAWIIDDASFPKKGKAIGGSDAPALWPAWQAGQLSGRSLAVDRQ